MKKLILLFAILLSSFATFAQDFTLLESQTFTGPFPDGIVTTTPVESNNSGFNSIKAVVQYEDISPDSCNCQVYAVLEEEIATNTWIAVANQFEAYSAEGNAPTRILELSPQFNANPGNDDFIDVPGGGIRISKTSDVAPVKFRVRIYVTEYSPNALDSLTVTIHGRKYNNN